MTKNVLNNDVVHHVKNMMLAQLKIALPKVGIHNFSDASRILNDDPASLYNSFLPDKRCMPIKSSSIALMVL